MPEGSHRGSWSGARAVAEEMSRGADGTLSPSEAEASTEPEWAPPTEFDEYAIVRLLGRGSMGHVYLARDMVLDRAVAVKFIHCLASASEDRERFLVEARAVARVQHPNVVTIHRVGELEGHPYLITEYVAGKSLHELELPVPWRKLLQFGVGVARGLAAAHRQGVLHRDIKLANVVLSGSGEVKLLDFSLAKLVDVATLERSMVASMHGARGERGAAEELEASGRRSSSVWVDGLTLSAGPAAELTMHGMLIGTPNYMAPELWRNEPASRRTDVYALGVLMYILATGRPAIQAEELVDLATRVQEEEPPPLLDHAPRCDARLASIIDRCVRRDPFDRFSSADELLAALESVSPAGRELAIPEGNPYRGLEAFESRHRALFFGRSVEIRAVLERLRTGALVVVAGDSGVGKSSLCKAGVIPQVEERALDPTRVWSSATMTPGRYPLQTLVATLARLFDLGEEAITRLLKAGATETIRALRRQLGEARGVLLMVDQLEELATLGAAQEVAIVGPLLAWLASGVPGLRVLASVRGDFLTRVAQLPGIGDELAQAIYFLRPLAPQGAREAIVGPARVKGVGFASEALVTELVTAGSQGSLPLLQFALAELWEIRDRAAHSITAEDLRKIGGVGGALARHADEALAELIPEQRGAARRVLMRLVTVEDTRAVRSEEELTANEPAAQAALKALVRSRLVLVREIGDQAVYEIAHEALIGGWATLGGWLEEARERRAVHHRLELAVAEWERLGHGRDALWVGAPLKELLGLDPGDLRAKERAFVAACAAAAKRARRIRRVLAAAVPVIVVASAGAVWLTGRADVGARVDTHAAAGQEERAAAERWLTQAQQQQTEAIAALLAGETKQGEGSWSRYAAGLLEVERALARAALQLELGLSLDAGRSEVRSALLEALYRRAEMAERAGRDALAVADPLERIALYDDTGEHMRRWEAPAELAVGSEPSGAQVTIERYVASEGHLRVGPGRALGTTPVAAQRLERGSYRLRFELPGRAPVVYPVLLGRAEAATVSVGLPAAEAVPAGFVYVPAGRFLYGASDPVGVREVLNAEPVHAVETGAYLIARHEVRYAEYLEYLAAQTPEERAGLLRAGAGSPARIEATGGGAWRLVLTLESGEHALASGAPLVYAGRRERASAAWEQLPLMGVDSAQAAAYMAWLARTGRVPGARYCNEYEWERAARGADGRRFPGGDELHPSDANFDATYGRVMAAFGPDAVGSYPQTQSPYGLLDADGNVYELTVSPHRAEVMVVRGGAYFFSEIQARTTVRFEVPAGFRSVNLGLRVCATWPPPIPSEN